jgi:hypothetical protein
MNNINNDNRFNNNNRFNINGQGQLNRNVPIINTLNNTTSDNILKIKFNALTTNGIIVKDELYKPLMSNPKLYNEFPNILFVPSIKITRGLFENTLGDDDIKKIFLSPAQLNNFIQRIKEKNMYKPITIKDAKEKGIIYNNIKFILDLFFVKGDKLVLQDTSYIINNYEWNNKYELKYKTGTKNPSVEISLDIYLHKGDELSFTDSTRLNCSKKKMDIVNDYYTLVGSNNKYKKTANIADMPTNTSNQPKKTSTQYNRRTRNTVGGRKKRSKHSKHTMRKRY